MLTYRIELVDEMEIKEAQVKRVTVWSKDF